MAGHDPNDRPGSNYGHVSDVQTNVIGLRRVFRDSLWCRQLRVYDKNSRNTDALQGVVVPIRVLQLRSLHSSKRPVVRSSCTAQCSSNSTHTHTHRWNNRLRFVRGTAGGPFAQCPSAAQPVRERTISCKVGATRTPGLVCVCAIPYSHICVP